LGSACLWQIIDKESAMFLSVLQWLAAAASLLQQIQDIAQVVAQLSGVATVALNALLFLLGGVPTV
jgi:hypothetical protein